MDKKEFDKIIKLIEQEDAKREQELEVNAFTALVNKLAAITNANREKLKL